MRRWLPKKGSPRVLCRAGIGCSEVGPTLGNTFKLLKDPFFIDQDRDITDRHFNPAAYRVVIYINEQT